MSTEAKSEGQRAESQVSDGVSMELIEALRCPRPRPASPSTPHPRPRMHPYQTSRDYPRLIQLMKEGHRLVCLVDYRFSSDAPDEPPCRDICHTRAGPPDPASQYQEVRSLWYLAVGCRGIEYIGGIRDTEEAFIAQCTRANLEWLVPSALPTEPQTRRLSTP